MIQNSSLYNYTYNIDDNEHEHGMKWTRVSKSNKYRYMKYGFVDKGKQVGFVYTWKWLLAACETHATRHTNHDLQRLWVVSGYYRLYRETSAQVTIV